MDDEADFEIEFDWTGDEDLGAPETPRPPRRMPRALVVEDDPEVARLCSKALERLGVRADVVWTRQDAVDRLSVERGPLAFAFLDGLRDGSGRGLADEARRLRPGMPVLGAAQEVEDVLVADRVVICKPFTSEEFEAAFDAAVQEEASTALLVAAAAAVRAEDEAAALAPPPVLPALVPEMPLGV